MSAKLRVEEVNRLLLKALNLKKEDFQYLKLPDYIPYPISYFYLMNVSPVDVFIKLVKKEKEEFVKRFNEDESFSKEDLSKYEELGLKEFFIYKDDNAILLNSLLIQTISELKNISDENANEILSDTFTISADMMRKIGITTESKAIADQTIVHIAGQVSKPNKLRILFKKIMEDTNSFSFRRSYLISLLAVSILPKLDWVNGEQRAGILLKLTMVAYFHDIYLEDEKLLKITTSEDFNSNKNNFTYKEREYVLNHANKAALLLQSYPKLPNGVDIIVKQHHGMGNGIGFAENLSAAISPLAIVFIVIEDFAHQILIAGTEFSTNEILIAMQMKYTLPSYRKIVEILLELSAKN